MKLKQRKRPPVTAVEKRRRTLAPLVTTPPREPPRDRTIRAWNVDAPKPPRAPSKAEIYAAEISAYVNRLGVSNTDEFRRKVAEEQLALRAANESVRNMTWVESGDTSHYRLYPHTNKEARSKLDWALRLLHPTKVTAVADAHFPKRWPAWAFYNDTRR
jgi:hypothetical protein